MARAAGMMLLAVLVLLTANVSAWSMPLGQSSRDVKIESFESEPDVTAPEIEQLLDEITVGEYLEEDARITTIITPILGENKKLHLKTLPSLEQRLFEGFPGSKIFRKSGSFKKSKLIKPRLHHQNAFDESDNQEISISMKPPQCSTAGLCRTTKKKCETVTCSTKQPCEPTAAPVTTDLCGTTEAPEEENCGTTEAPEKENCEITENSCEKTREPCESKKSFCATKKAPKSVPRKFPGSKNFRKSGSFKKSKLIRPRLHQQKVFDESDNQEISISMKPPQCSTAGLCRTTKKKCKTVTCLTKQPCEPTAAPVTPDLCGTTEAPEEENCGTTETPEKENCEITENSCEKTREPCESKKSFCATKKAPKSVPRKFPGSKNFRKSGSFKKSKLIRPRLHQQKVFDESDNQEISISMKPPQCSTAGLCRTTKKKCKTVTCLTKQPCEPTAAPVTPDLCGTTEAPEEENCGTTEAPKKEDCEITENPCEKTREPCESTKSFCATKKAPKSVPRKFPGSKNFRKSGSFKKSKLIKPRLHHQNAFDESDNQEISISMKPPQCSTAGLCKTTKKKCKTVTCSTKQPCEPTAAPVTPDLCGTTEAPEEENCGTTEAPEKENCEITENSCEKTREPCESKKSFCATKKAPKSVSRKFPGSKNFRKSGSFKKSKLIRPRLHQQKVFDESDNQEISISMKPPQCSTAGLCRTTRKKCKTVTCLTKQPCEPTAAPVTPDLCGTTEAPEEENCGTTEAPKKEDCEITENPCEKTREPCESTKSFCATKKAPKSVPRKFPGSKNFRKSGSFKKSKLIKPRLHHQNAFDESDNQEISISMKPPQCSTAGLCRTTRKKCKTVTCLTKQPCEPTAAPVTPDLCGTTEAPEEENCGTTEAPKKEDCEITENPCEKTREPCESTKSFCATKKAPKSVPRKFPGSKNFRKSGSFKKSKLIKPRLHHQNAFDESDNQEISISMKPPQCSTAGLFRTTKKKCKTVSCSTKQPCEPTAAPVTPDLCGTTEALEEENCGTTESPEKESCETT